MPPGQDFSSIEEECAHVMQHLNMLQVRASMAGYRMRLELTPDHLSVTGSGDGVEKITMAGYVMVFEDEEEE